MIKGAEILETPILKGVSLITISLTVEGESEISEVKDKAALWIAEKMAPGAKIVKECDTCGHCLEGVVDAAVCAACEDYSNWEAKA